MRPITQKFNVSVTTIKYHVDK